MSQALHTVLQEVGLTIPTGLINPTLTDITSDSRSVRTGSLFLGLPGERVDGGRFWRQALDAGAAAALIGPAAAQAAPPGDGDPVIVVSEPVAQLIGEVSAAFWTQPSHQMALIGVTGTNGKTTTTHLIEHLAGVAGQPTGLFGTLVNRWPGHSVTAQHTTAFADRLQAQLAEAVAAGCKLAAMEVSSHALAQHRVAGCRFSGAVFTNLTQDHLDYHASMEDYFEAKASLFVPPLLETQDAGSVVNIDDPWGVQLAQRLSGRCWRSSLNDPSAELTMVDLEMTGHGVEGRLLSPSGDGQFRSPLLGRFNLMNLLQALGALLQQGLPLGPLLEAIGCFGGVPGRMERVLVPGADTAALPTVLVDYAHTPDGLENALAASRPFTNGRLVCVFGCGGDRDRGKRPQMAAIAARLADRVVITSDNPRTEDLQRILNDVQTGLPAGTDHMVEANRAVAIAAAIAEASPQDLVLVAGKGHEDYQILGTEKVHFDDREQSEQALRQRLS
ncbi:UDP-N-acetylmuramoyl-L-alanyl-D-glutamate--2,6-diaminopimelate ligase [Synechococcus sp. CC9616]|uniref:UDP-N-acetylmuramoyl-L-alanyl-D-glutamate--2, 6-diaminopimelate ligase n=1 Tax=Synechococcus sp. CC9616 TaxID=110663 RepID=UPI00048E7653|nr:UDP-N-acetylmuramoyl-L-alanyl-D-glutamate--2,6-diaminopimelate ligase [Synechococcus sp. CC9616]